jgi:DNA-binding response OmpR family regulator
VTAARHTVLIVDDEHSIRLLCRINLELVGHRVLEASTIDKARTLIDEETVDVIVLDVHVGADSGLDFLAELRDSGRPERVALLTGTADRATVEAAGADAVLGKPFELDELHDAVARLGAGINSDTFSS